jgi:exodeoxyribonuclease VII large subunit
MAEGPAGALPRTVWSVGALLLALGDLLASRFAACTVRGELSGFTRAASGHCYFTLKDADGAAAALRCAMFRRAATLLDFAPRDGQQVELRGRVALFEPRGELQFVVESMQQVGAGSLYEQFLRLKAQLQAQGLFDAARKRALPRFAFRIGIVTSLAGAALHDVLSTLARRAPQVAVVLYPSPVQGAEAPPALVAALQAAAQRREVDLLLLCRGGGALEDLWAFNDERVVRAVAAAPMPVICGVGHETDVTLADFAADLRAPTPTAAAELAAPAQQDLLAQLAALAQRMTRQMRRQLEQQAQRVDQRAWQLARPAALLARQAQRLDALQGRCRHGLLQAVQHKAHAPQALAGRLQHAGALQRQSAAARLQALQTRLDALDPRRVLARGYVWVTDEAAQPVLSVRGLQPGQRINAVWADGTAIAELLSVLPSLRGE